MQITPGLHSLGDTSGGRVRAFLIDDGNGLTLIDTLLNKDGRDILDEIRRLGKTTQRPQADYSDARSPVTSRRTGRSEERPPARRSILTTGKRTSSQENAR